MSDGLITHTWVYDRNFAALYYNNPATGQSTPVRFVHNATSKVRYSVIDNVATNQVSIQKLVSSMQH